MFPNTNFLSFVIATQYYLRIEKSLTNITRNSGDNVRLKCEFTGNPMPKVHWFKNEAPIETERDKIQIKLTKVQPDRVRARVIIKRLDTHDTGYYKCVANNAIHSVESVGVLIVKTGKSTQQYTDAIIISSTHTQTIPYHTPHKHQYNYQRFKVKDDKKKVKHPLFII